MSLIAMSRHERRAVLERWATAAAEPEGETKAALYAGTSSVVLATTGVMDRDADLLVPGLLVNDGDTVDLSSWNHELMHDAAAQPVGRAVIHERGNQLLADVAFDASAEGRAALERVRRERPDLSFGYTVLATRPVTARERAEGVERAITRLRIVEVSFVDRGASAGSATLHTCVGGPDACPLTAGKGADCRACPHAHGLAPDDPQRVQLEERWRTIRIRSLALTT